MEVSDEHILAAFKSESTRIKAFEQLVEKYKERLYWHIRRILKNHNDTDDVLQNSLLKIWKYLGNFKGNSQLYTWLYRIATNEALSFIEQQKKRTSTSLDEEGKILYQVSAPTPMPAAEDIEARLQQAIDSLPDKQKLVFNLRYYDEMPYEQMSEVLETSVGALKASYHHAAKKIEKFLTGD